ncbi:MAG: hypothetical protein KAT15_18560, partial [Bacteroidales bacterium]|nr:hypothetical protein [Bacteroidales bacterium]
MRRIAHSVLLFPLPLLKASFQRCRGNKITHSLATVGYSLFCGERGIRTLGAREEHNGFRDR